MLEQTNAVRGIDDETYFVPPVTGVPREISSLTVIRNLHNVTLSALKRDVCRMLSVACGEITAIPTVTVRVRHLNQEETVFFT